jgi:uncharacterized membrane protein
MDTFSKEDTNVLKGVAILFMLFYHLFFVLPTNPMYVPLFYIGSKPLPYLLSSCTYPVDFFIILSGYGLYISYRKGKNNNIKRNIKLYIHYWITLIIFVSIGCYLKGSDIYPGNFQKILLNVTALKTTYNTSTWFLFPYMLLSLSSYYLFKVFDKLKPILVFLVLLVISLITQTIIHFNQEYVNSHILVIQLLSYFDLLFPFSLGMILAKYFKYNQIKEKLYSIKHINVLLSLSILLIMIMMMLLQDHHPFIFQPYYALAFILVFSYIRKSNFLNRFLNEMGRRSTSMWFVHLYFISFISRDFIYGFKYPVIIYIVFILISYISAIVIDKINDKIQYFCFRS